MSSSSTAPTFISRGPAHGRYELEEQLAVGGMGVIHQAYDRWAQREVAYKALKVKVPAQRARMTALFQREYATLARLTHPNIVEVYDYGQDSEGPYYVMELLSGADLSELAPLPYRQACRVLRDVASALALVHARRYVHRDLSPNNVRLTGDGRAKLIDFGALAAFGRTSELVGTPGFMAPECLKRGELDQRSDLYALGALAYWTLTGRMPIKARSLEEQLLACEDAVRPPSEHVPEIPVELDQLILSMLALDPLARPTSAAHVIDRLTAIASLEPEADERRVAYGYLAHPTLAGRADVLTALQEALGQSARGDGGVVTIEAHAGLGRSSVLEHVARLTQLSGATLLRAQGQLNAAPFSIARRLRDATLALFPELDEGVERTSPTLQTSPQRARTGHSAVEIAEHHAALVSALSAVLVRAAELAPLVILIDDLHLCDRESLALLASIAEGAARDKITLVASTLAGHPGTLDSAHKRIVQHALRLSLTALDAEQMVDFVDALFGGVPNSRRLAQWLYAQTHGVPSSAVDLARLLLQHDVIRYAHGTFTLPHDFDEGLSWLDVRSATLARVADLSGDARRVIELLALHQGGLTAGQLAHAAGLRLRHVLPALEELTGRGAVHETDTGYALPAITLRSAIAEGLDDARQKQLHAELARALLAQPDGSHEVELQASVHLIACGASAEAAELGVPALSKLSLDAVVRWVPLVEALLAIYRAQGRSKAQCLRLMLPLVFVGFYGDLAAQRRHIDSAIAAMSSLSGMTLASRLRSFLGGKLALLIGLAYGGVRNALAPKRDRFPRMLHELVSMVIGGCAAAASALDSAAVARFARFLEPLAALPADSSGYLLREYCLAIAETSAGDFEASAKRYAHLLPTFSKPLKGMDETLRKAVYLGALNGFAQAELKSGSPRVLELADELGRGDPFFAPHAECARMAYYAYRGDQVTASMHRARAELLALRGGVSWSAVTILTVRLAYAAVLTRDVLGLVHAIAELDRLSAIAPKLTTCKRVMEAWLAYLRGRPELSAELFDAFIDGEDARLLASHVVDRILYAVVLNEVGRNERAREVCEELLHSVRALNRDLSTPLGQLAIAEANLGRREVALALMAEHVELAEASKNPLVGGNAHRDAAQLAMVNRDQAAFDRHFERMQELFRLTGNPLLIQQCDALLAHALRSARPVGHARGASLPSGSDLVDSDTQVDASELEADAPGLPHARSAGGR